MRREEILLRAAVVQSVGQISGVDAVLFMIDGESLQDMNGQVVGYMQPSDFVKNTGVESPFLSERDIFVVLW